MIRRLTTKEAAEIAGVCVKTIRRAIHSTDQDSFPPPLPAHRSSQGARAHFRIREDDFQDWLDRIEETCPI